MSVHSALTDSAEIHEDKRIVGSTTGDTGKVITPDGVTNGVSELRNLVETEIDEVIDFYAGKFTDVATAGSEWVPVVYAGTIVDFRTVLHGAITSSDETLRLRINTVAVTDSTITIANAGSAAGDVDTATPSAANTVAAGDSIQVQTDGNATGATSASFVVAVKRS